MTHLNASFREILALEKHEDREIYYRGDQQEFLDMIVGVSAEKRLEMAMFQSIWGRSLGRGNRDKRPEDIRNPMCKWCWFQVNYCICSELQIFEGDLPCELVIMLHYQEYRRVSNTAKLVMHALPNCKVFLYPYSKHMKELKEIIDSRPTYVLFPTEEAKPIKEMINTKDSDSNSSDPNDPSLKPVILVLDGTWKEARKMKNHEILKGVPEIRLDDSSVENHKSLFLARQKSNVLERISTLEAIALCLTEYFHYFHGDDESIAVLPPLLLENLQIAMKSLLMQNGTPDKTNYKRRDKNVRVVHRTS